MPFGMGFGELILIVIIVLVVFGATKLPQLGEHWGEQFRELQQDRPEFRLVRAPDPERWTWRDWLRVCVAVALGVLAVLSVVRSQR